MPVISTVGKRDTQLVSTRGKQCLQTRPQLLFCALRYVCTANANYATARYARFYARCGGQPAHPPSITSLLRWLMKVSKIANRVDLDQTASPLGSQGLQPTDRNSHGRRLNGCAPGVKGVA